MGTGVAVRGTSSPRASAYSLGSRVLLGIGFGPWFSTRLSPTKCGDAALEGQGVQTPPPRRSLLVSNSPGRLGCCIPPGS